VLQQEKKKYSKLCVNHKYIPRMPEL
jgi:hypothetical protein